MKVVPLYALEKGNFRVSCSVELNAEYSKILIRDNGRGSCFFLICHTELLYDKIFPYLIFIIQSDLSVKLG